MHRGGSVCAARAYGHHHSRHRHFPRILQDSVHRTDTGIYSQSAREVPQQEGLLQTKERETRMDAFRRGCGAHHIAAARIPARYAYSSAGGQRHYAAEQSRQL